MLTEIGFLLRHQQRQRVAVAAHSRGAANAMHKHVGVLRQVKSDMRAFY